MHDAHLLTLARCNPRRLLEIIKYFPVAYIVGEGTIVNWPSGRAELCKANAPETIALAGCNRELRRLLLPVMFHDCHFGKADPTEKYAKRLDELSRGSGEMLACIRCVLRSCRCSRWRLTGLTPSTASIAT